MALTNIPLIDQLMTDKPGEIKAGSDPAAVAAVQDLLHGHGFARLPGLLGDGRGIFGARTRVATAIFRKANGLSPGEAVDAATLQQLVNVAAREPIASEAYIALALDIQINKNVRLVALVSRFGGPGDFKRAEFLSDKAGLAAGFLPWTQAHGFLHDMLESMSKAAQDVCPNYFGGKKNLAALVAAISEAAGFGLPGGGAMVLDLSTDPWKSTFAAAGTSVAMQTAQVSAGVETLIKAFTDIATNMQKLVSERAIAFALDMILNFGFKQAKSFYVAAEAGTTDLFVIMAAMRDSATSAIGSSAGENSQASNRTFERYNNYIHTGLLSDLPFVPEGATTPGSGLLPEVNLGRFFLPPQKAFGLLAPAVGAEAEAFINTPEQPALIELHDAITSAKKAGDFIYMLNWHCDADMELIKGNASSTLRNRLKEAVEAGVQVRGMFWGGFVLPDLHVYEGALLLLNIVALPATLPLFVTLYEVLRTFVTERPEADVNSKAIQLFKDLKTPQPGDPPGLTRDIAGFSDSNHPFAGTHHQKVLVVRADGELTAFVGGVEYNLDRNLPAEDPLTNPTGAPLFDTTVKLHQPAARLALRTFVNRWKQVTDAPLADEGTADPGASTGPLTVQLSHTSAPGHPFKLRVVSAADALSNGILSAQSFIYIEDQYFVGSTRQREALLQALRNQPKLQLVAVIANQASFTDYPQDLVKFRRDQFIQKLHEKFGAQLLVFERLGLTPGPALVPSATGNSAYVHSKLMIVDDEAAFIGSANSSRRSWFFDSEVTATIVDTKNGAGEEHPVLGGWVRQLRCRLWKAHVQEDCTGNPAIDLNTWRELFTGISPLSSKALVRPYHFDDPPTAPSSVKGRSYNVVWDSFIDPTGGGLFTKDPDTVKNAI